MKPQDKQNLNSAVFRVTGDDPAWLGHWIRQFQRSERIEPAEVANQLGIDIDALVLLCLCKTPRQDRFDEDLQVACKRTGADQVALARIIRQEQALTQWRDRKSADTTGWLLAASDSAQGPGEVRGDTGAADDED
jgi:hypothetical protein